MAGKKDLKLDKLTHDLVIADSDFQMITGIEWLEQAIKTKLIFFLVFGRNSGCLVLWFSVCEKS